MRGYVHGNEYKIRYARLGFSPKIKKINSVNFLGQRDA